MADNKENKVLNVPALRFPEFSGEWNTSSIGEQFELYSGNTPSRMDKKQFDGTVNWITSGELKEHYIADTKEKISDEAVKSNNLKLLPVGTFVIAIYGLEADGVRGTCSITTSESTISQACMAFISKKVIANEFLYAWYKKHGNVIGIRYAQGTKQQNLSYDIIEKFNISYPCIGEQKKLIRFISLIDERIATQNKIIEKLETLIKGIRNYVLNNKLQNTTKKKLGGLCTITTGKLDANAMKSEGLYPFFTCAEEVYRIDSFAFDTEALLVSGNGANLGYIHYYKGKFNAYQRTYVLSNFIEDIHYIQIYLEAYLHKRIALEKSTSNTPYIVLATLAEMPIIIPNIKIQKDISNKILILKSKLITEIHIRNCYKDMRQFLLSQMFI